MPTEATDTLPTEIIIPRDEWPLDFWDSKEWADVQKKLKSLEYNPGPERLFRALSLCSLDRCRVCMVLQDPYPNSSHATGVGLSTGPGGAIPPSLGTVYREYVRDVHYQRPKDGNLEPWCAQGVLLWNATPTIGTNPAVSHSEWEEWHNLTQEIVERLNAKGKVVFVFIGARARRYSNLVNDDPTYCTKMFFTHPSPRTANVKISHPHIAGSRLFSTINDHLKNIHFQEPIFWKLEGAVNTDKIVEEFVNETK